MNKILVDRRTLISGMASTVLMSACSKRPPSTKSIVGLRQEWFPYAGYAGEVLAETQFGNDFGVEVEVRSGGQAIDPLRKVVNGDDTIGVSSADLLLSARARGAKVKCIGVINDVSPTCFLVKSDSNITTPDDFIGRKVGILPGTNTEKIYQLMMLRNEINRNQISETEVPFDVRTFITGNYDVRPAFIYDEPVTLNRERVGYDIIKPADFGVSFVGTVYFVTETEIENNREALVNALASLVKGWESCQTSEGQEKAISALKIKFPEIDSERELESLRLGAQLFAGPQGSRPLDTTEGNWTQTITGLEELGVIDEGSASFDDAVDLSLLYEAYERT